MIKKLVVSAVFAGFAAGLIAAVLQFSFVQPVLLEAELYESGAKKHTPVSGGHSHGAEEEHAKASEVAHDHSSHDHGEEATDSALTIDFKRDGLSLLFTIFVYTGYGLILVAGFQLASERGFATTARTGLLWGVAGFVTVHLAPALGLPPELPGMAAADVFTRQIWWAGTVIATGLGLGLVAFGTGPSSWVLAAGLLLAPHIIGAPHPDAFTGTPPPELASLFASRALGVGLAAWALLGLFAGYFWNKHPEAH